MRIKPEVKFRFSPSMDSSVPFRYWWSVPNLVEIGEELRTLSSGTDIHTLGRRNLLAPPMIKTAIYKKDIIC